MRFIGRPFGLLACVLLAFFGLSLLAPSAQAQTSSLGSSSSALGMLQGLSPEEQQAILGRISGAGTLGTGTSELNNFPGALGQGNQGQMQLLQQEMAVRERRQEEEHQPLIPTVRGGDWVIVEIGFHLPPRPAPETPLALQQAYGAQAQLSGVSPQNLQALSALQGSSTNTAATPTQASAPEVPATQMTTAEKERLSALMDVIRSRNPYQLSRTES